MQQLSFEINQAIHQAGIKKCFEMGGKLTVQEAFWKFKTTELRKIVSRLKKAGLPIISKRKVDETYHEYYLAN
ncbi:hypothetical protein [Mucilaginibacter sp. 10I4]|uniref:hypothetical protein n=1 Tax=Mucilaginibacter sp. 10I4 TaxID=3048580 RepID=UPI002B23B145|nr:hypothetical protein [Mucilaginibacter sp. 10I4]MEB0262878.1 hypothetical protein [Mucilaginibacter sp. 10I4]